jgi:hypothetical protein
MVVSPQIPAGHFFDKYIFGDTSPGFHSITVASQSLLRPILQQLQFLLEASMRIKNLLVL